MRYLLAVLTAIVISLAVVAGLQYRQIGALRASAAASDATLRSTQADLSAARAAAQLAEQVILQRDRSIRQLRAAQALRQKELDRVLQDHRSWADQSVPPGVADWVRNLDRPVGGDAQPAPGDTAAGLPSP